MTADELGKILSTMYEDAPQNDSVAMIHLFGIMHANEIHTCSMREIVAAAGIPASYVSEVAKGVRLAKYVTVK